MRKDFASDLCEVVTEAKLLRGCMIDGLPDDVNTAVQALLVRISDLMATVVQNEVDEVIRNLASSASKCDKAVEITISVPFPLELYRAFCLLTWPVSLADRRAHRVLKGRRELPDAATCELGGHSAMFLTQRIRWPDDRPRASCQLGAVPR